ncbi:radical SAM protein [Paenibacillus sp. FSL P2-0089]|uniref:radical SAM protein n=1 Tax=Paenibacillus sp. FSL P2-0089 TaxID=2954526 RepID=UPI00315A5E78
MNIFLEVTNYCELKCRFCVADLGYKYPSTNLSMNVVDEIIEKYRYDKKNAVFITGGEPLLHPQLAEIIQKFASNHFYTYITTNGQRLQDEKYAVKFMTSGIRRIAIPIYGSNAEVHDNMTGITGSFVALQRGLDHIFYIKNNYLPHIKIELRLLMAKFNISENEHIIEWIMDKYPEVDYVSLMGLQLSSRTNNYEDMIEISMSEAAADLRTCLTKIREYNVNGLISGIPLCVLGEDFADFYATQSTKENSIRLFPHLSIQPHLKTLKDGLYREESSKQKAPEICNNCRFEHLCDGIQERYVHKYGFSDLKAIL